MGTCGTWIEAAAVPCARDADPALALDAVRLATGMLYLASGQRWPGLCTTRARPCAARGYGYGRSPDALPATGRSERFGHGCGCSGETVACGCPGVDAVWLPQRPVRSVEEVTVDGVALADGSWRIVDEQWVVRTDGERWPCCQDLSKDHTEDGTSSILYTWGSAPEHGGEVVAGVLACELIKAWTPGCEDECRLPIRVQAVVREGLSVQVLDPSTILSLEEGGLPRFGLWEVATWLASVNPDKLTREAKCIDPSRYRPRQVR